MKTQLSKPARSKARYTDQYKQEALELWRASGRSAAKVAAELGIRPPLLYRWAHAERVNWKTSACASASERNLLAVARLTAAHDWLMRWVVRDGATALPALCAWSGSSLDSAPSIERPSLIAATADPSRLTDCTTSLFDAPIKSGSAMPPQC